MYFFYENIASSIIRERFLINVTKFTFFFFRIEIINKEKNIIPVFSLQGCILELINETLRLTLRLKKYKKQVKNHKEFMKK